MQDFFDLHVSELRENVESVSKNQQFWLGVVGAPGSGKSTLSNALCKEIGDESVIIPMDGYHFYRAQLDVMPNAAEAYRRRGAPFTFDGKRFVRDLTFARQTRTGTFPSFQHGVGDPVEDDIQLDPQHRLVIVEGNYLLLDEEPWCQLAKLFDETWFLQVDLDVILERLKKRFVNAGMTEAAAIERAEYNDIPNAKLIDAQSRVKADRIVTV
ncbi:MAG: hypothetical protein WBD20_06705 [Pirellulaceae bacterium]